MQQLLLPPWGRAVTVRLQPWSSLFKLRPVPRCSPSSGKLNPRKAHSKTGPDQGHPPRSSSLPSIAQATQHPPFPPMHQTGAFPVLKEELVYSRYIRVFNREVEQPIGLTSAPAGQPQSSHVVEYDVVASKSKASHFCTVFPYHSATKTVTLLREYSQGANALVYTVPCGGLSESHLSIEDCARRELSEEAHLCGGTLIKLIKDGHPGLLEVKWCMNRFTPFLVMDPMVDNEPHPRDAEEVIEILQVDILRLKDLMYSGDMMLPSIVTCSLAMEKLRRDGHL